MVELNIIFFLILAYILFWMNYYLILLYLIFKIALFYFSKKIPDKDQGFKFIFQVSLILPGEG